MATYEVETHLIVRCRVTVLVEAESPSEALAAAGAQLPQHSQPGSAARWGARVQLRAPRGVEIAVKRADHFEQDASEGDRARKVMR